MKPKLLTMVTFVAAVSAGCAAAPEPADEMIVRAETTIENASQGGAAEYASTALDGAHKKLSAAKVAAESGEHDQAMRLAQEAEIDAEVAMALADQAEAEGALREVREGLDTLRQELDKDVYRPGDNQ